MRTPFWLTLALLAACGGDKDGTDTGPDTDTTVDETDTDTDADADADADTDTDTDADSDADTDTDTDADTDTGTTYTTPPTSRFDCFATFEADAYDDGSVDYDGLDAYDSVNNDWLVWLERDFDLDGAVDYYEEYTYDAAGNPLTALSEDLYYGDLFYDEYSWNASGDLLEIRSDTDGDGAIDYVASYTYDTYTGFLSVYSEDADNDGSPDYVQVYTRDAYGVLQTLEVDEDGDATTDTWYTYTYDPGGRLIEVSGDTGNDGTVDYLQTTIYSDPTLEIGNTIIDDPVDGVPDYVIRFENDANGLPVYEAEDSTPDGNWDYELYYTWDPVTEQLLEYDYLFSYLIYDLVQHAEFTYDGQNRLIESFLDIGLSFPAYSLFSERDTWSFGGTCP